ncbi:hypothetical protein FNO01nite_28390 [Flavobacterium noncentrifugens]|uniref:helix-turn-helix domain-containing protein n=1 Tax=Flavobacterium noncentrifugens TaxID=1128970 RepID=UPI000B827722|nr:hypothetical protein FNO01nite_28390 [Flavobacterium noncentrifugens]
MERSRARFRYDERVIIQTLLTENRSITYIADILNRHRSSVFREVKKWIVKPTDKYNADLAQFIA